MKMVEVTSDPARTSSIWSGGEPPADELMGRRMETGLLVLGGCGRPPTGTGSCASGCTPIPRHGARRGRVALLRAPRHRANTRTAASRSSSADLLGLRSGGGVCAPLVFGVASFAALRLRFSARPASGFSGSGTRSAATANERSLLQIPWTPISASSRIRAGSSTVQAISSTFC